MKWILGGVAAAICASVIAVLLVFFMSGEDASAQVSTDLDALRSTITLDIAAKSGTWEIFGTPEYRGGIPAPTDYVTLIAELSLADAGAAFPREPAGRRMVAPEAARPWLSKTSRAWLKQIASPGPAPATPSPCRILRTTVKKTGTPVEGFICRNAHKALVYFTITDSTAT